MQHEMSEMLRALMTKLQEIAATKGDPGHKWPVLYVTEQQAGALVEELLREIDLAWRYRDLQD